MKMKKLLCLIMAVCMLVAAAACGASKDNAPEESGNSTEEESKESEETPSEEASDGEQEEEVSDGEQTEEPKSGETWDYSSIDVFMDDPMFGDGCVFYSDLQKIWQSKVPVPETPLKIGYVGKSFENEYWRLVKAVLPYRPHSVPP